MWWRSDIIKRHLWHVRRLTCNNSMAYLKNWTDNFFQIFFMRTSWVAVSINNITTRASREMMSRKNIEIFDLMGWTLPSTGMWRTRYLPSLIALLEMPWFSFSSVYSSNTTYLVSNEFGDILMSSHIICLKHGRIWINTAFCGDCGLIYRLGTLK